MTVVLITGALTGIGRATALAFAREGDQIVASGRHGEAGEELAQELRAQGAEAEFTSIHWTWHVYVSDQGCSW